jgi:hypothetical protein
MQYQLCRINDDSTTTVVSEHTDFLTRIAAGGYAVEVEDFDFAYCLKSVDGVRVATFREGRIGYRKWTIRSGRLAGEYIHSIDDKYDHYEDEVMSR